jgi:hypothetical protein
MAETSVLFDREGVTVSPTSITIRGTVYSVSSISSVAVTRVPAKKGCAIAILLFFSWLAVMAILDEAAPEGLTVFLMAGTSAALAGFWIWMKKPSYVLRLGQGVGEVHAFVTRDREFAFELAQAVQQALQSSKNP